MTLRQRMRHDYSGWTSQETGFGATSVDLLSSIKRLVLQRRIVFTRKAACEMEAAGITTEDVIEAIANSHRIHKVIRSRSPMRGHVGERLYVIKGMTLDNMVIYTKGKIVREAGHNVFYVLVSCKEAL